ncbi:MAG: hypothetical protein LUG95_05430 [Clostridiales bacterium]|nr:hypothetical protein [Clostridiales bacterium]
MSAGAVSWTINGVTVAYGETYTFYVGADITLVPVYDTLQVDEILPCVSIISVGQSSTSTGLIKGVFLATRDIPSGFTHIGSGFIYGRAKYITSSVTLEDVDSSTVKSLATSTSSLQFSLSYGLSAQTGSIAAKAYLIYMNNSTGESFTIYLDPEIYTYA